MLTTRTDAHNFYGAVNYISSYVDRRSDVEVAPHTTIDATYTYSWDDLYDFSFSVYNLTNENPSFRHFWEMNYDPYTHSPLGRFLKLDLLTECNKFKYHQKKPLLAEAFFYLKIFLILM